ncbi:TPA: hypothetical protein QDB15_006170 [Burkholderia vietnamiensis]|uniref:Uncharacterized protein n=1 Tax=Burkholderia vietnamiensis TaxID=60552 RepID=A0AA44XWP2_BURVI|nr:hypothetical protein [Burkholderia vietnamiensis]KVF77504.1 hypothetical protein WJ18_17730 [Burkholderia vietnamiensis]KVF89628.1 hypothetical protein WJ19_05655 [Burkholderia vietnamiensis]KVF93404.1 hypothetical protein WJ20_06320 [Burkholderia vietnamiensis]KVF96481.1 hypothetical protein WJ22_26265 [Burkholderia vietnamiensis]KVS06235.1 hypothetical protein WK32_11970 [Burkholderia vietnamiensis]
METSEHPQARRRVRRAWAACITMLCVGWSTLSFGADGAAALLERYHSLGEQLKHNAFHRPLYLESSEASSSLKGDIYAVVDYPFAVVNGKLSDPAQGPANWCAVLILHLNTKYCHASAGSGGPVLDVNLGRKVEQKLSDTYRVQFRYRVAASTPDYFQVDLSADSGPMGTKDYRIALEAVPVGASRTFLHLTYAYGFGTVGRMAMKTYLATIGSDKVGFTPASGASAGEPQYVGGVRGLLERNTMRYYLAIDAYLATLDKPLDQRLARWFDATEQYPQQLHEVDRAAYLQMKAQEVQRQQAAR